MTTFKCVLSSSWPTNTSPQVIVVQRSHCHGSRSPLGWDGEDGHVSLPAMELPGRWRRCTQCSSKSPDTHLSHRSPVALALQTQRPEMQPPVLPAGSHSHRRLLQQGQRDPSPAFPAQLRAQCPQLLHRTAENPPSYPSHARKGKIISRAMSLSNPAVRMLG